MEDNSSLIETLLDNAIDYGKTSFNLAKLKVVDEASDRISSFLPSIAVLLISGTIMTFLNFGIAFWIGKLMGDFFYGFFIVAAFYILLAIVFHFFMRDWMKKIFYDYIIRRFLE